jgi:hypothetical protein
MSPSGRRCDKDVLAHVLRDKCRSRGPSISSIRPFSCALVQQPLANHEVVARIARPARF